MLFRSDTNSERRDLFQKKYGAKIDIFEEYTELIPKINYNEIKVDIIVIATPDSTHSDILKFIINNLKDLKKPIIVFCEKPLAMSSKSAREIQKLKPQFHIVVNHTRRWSKIWQNAFVLSKKIGDIEKVEFNFSTSPENRQVLQIRDGIHIADLMSWFDVAQKTTISRLNLPYFVYECSIWGSKGKIEILNAGQTLRFFIVVKSKRFQGFNELKLSFSKTFTDAPLANAYSEFVKFLTNKTARLSTNFDDAINALDIFEKYVYDPKIKFRGGTNVEKI